MRNIILVVAVSLDGYIEGPQGEIDWCFTDQDYGMSTLFQRIDSLFIGRKTYELMQRMGEAATPGFPPLREYIFSSTLSSVKPGAMLINGNLEAEVRRIRNEAGKDIWLFGGASLTGALLNLGLVDEITLAVHPILLGGGKRLFHHISERQALVLTDSKTYSTGLVSLTYRFNRK